MTPHCSIRTEDPIFWSCLIRRTEELSPSNSSCSIVTLSEVPAVCWAPRLLPAPFRSLDACRLGTNDPCCDRKVAKLIGPPNTSPCGNMSRNLEDGSIGPKYPDLNRTNEHRYIIVLVKALFSRESSGTSRSLLPSPRTFEGLDWISQVAKPFASTPPSSPCCWLKWWVISHPTKPFYPATRSLSPITHPLPSRWSSDSTLLHTGTSGLLCSRTR